MENHVFKPHYRHGHHHHKNQMFYALLSMVFFALIAAAVVASIYYALGGENRNPQTANVNNNAAGTCLVGTIDCDDTPETPTPPSSDSREVIQQPAANEPAKYVNSDAGYEVEVPAGLAVRGFSSFDVYLAELENKWVLAVTVAPNAQSLTLEEAFQNLYDQNLPNPNYPSEYQEYKLDDMHVSNMRLDGVAAKRLSIDNFGDGGATMIVAVNNGYIYTIRGSLGELYEGVPDVLDFVQTFRFLD
jgi:hypothetical protein